MSKKCPICEYQLSEQAKYCPICGWRETSNHALVNEVKTESPSLKDNPSYSADTVERDDSYLCCPKCGSRELHSGQKGFSGGKALAGAIAVGGIGLLAGTIGSKDVIVTCLACGHKTKAGELKTVYTGSYKKEFDSKLRELMCDIMALEDAHKLFLTQYGVTEEDWKKYNDNFNKEIEENKLSPEEREKLNGSINKFNNSGCMVLLIAIVMLSSLIVSFV